MAEHKHENPVQNLVHLTNDNFKEEVLESATPIIIDFWAEWCGPCKLMGPIFEELSEDYKGKIKFAKLNTEECPEIAETFHVSGIPTLSIVYKKEEINRLVGYRPKEALRKDIDATLKKVYK